MVHFFGPDGAGKTTQVNILVAFLSRRKIPVRKIWVRSPHTMAFLLWRLFAKIGFYRTVVNPFGPPGRLPAVDRNCVLRRFWSAAEFLSVLPLIARVNYLGRKNTLVAERYLVDTVTTVAYFLNDLDFINSWTSRLLLRFIPKDTAFVFLDTDYATIYGRRAGLYDQEYLKKNRKEYGATPTCPVEPRSFIDFQRKAYRTLAKSFDPLTIDTSKHSIEDTTNIILQFLGFRQ
jgi:thymidylate kinase